MKLNYPAINVRKNGQIFISFVLDNKRIRLASGKKIGVEIYPNSYPSSERYKIAKILCSEVYNYLLSGGKLDGSINTTNYTELQYLELALENKLKENITKGYKTNLTYVFDEVTSQYKTSKSLSKSIKVFLDKYTSSTSYNTLKKHIKVLVNEAIKLGLDTNPMKDIKSRKGVAKLHKPFKGIKAILNELEEYNTNLYLCCLITYGCLLRPHREIRELTWGDFSNDMTQINLSGERNKSGKNRIVPVPQFIIDRLVKGRDEHNIFTDSIKPLNECYFKTLWSRFKSVSKVLQEDQTLYSFRHSGAIDVYSRTKDLNKLQTVMGHSSLNVSLTYLRGLEVTRLSVSDMPSL